jgi:hypothetical protein
MKIRNWFNMIFPSIDIPQMSTDIPQMSKRDIEPNSDLIRFLGNAKPLLLRLADAIHGRSHPALKMLILR